MRLTQVEVGARIIVDISKRKTDPIPWCNIVKDIFGLLDSIM